MLLGNHFNLYTLSKAMSEKLVRQRAKQVKFACGVYRPSMVINALEEPLVGWVGNANGPVLAFVMAGLGIAHVYINDGKPMDMVPCDFAINALLIVTWNLTNQRVSGKEADVYNYGSRVLNPVSLSGLFDMLIKAGTKEVASKAIGMRFLFQTTSLWLFILMHFLFHFVPAFIADVVLLLSCNKPKALLAFWKATKVLDTLTYFSNTDWKIHMPKTLNVIKSLNSVDKELFKCDVRKINWEEFAIIASRGTRKYIIKESLNNDSNVRRYMIICFASLAFVSILIFSIIYCIVRLV